MDHCQKVISSQYSRNGWPWNAEREGSKFPVITHHPWTRTTNFAMVTIVAEEPSCRASDTPHLSELWFNISKLTPIRSDLQGRNSTWKHTSETGVFLGSVHILRGRVPAWHIVPGTLYMRAHAMIKITKFCIVIKLPRVRKMWRLYKLSQLRLS